MWGKRVEVLTFDILLHTKSVPKLIIILYTTNMEEFDLNRGFLFEKQVIMGLLKIIGIQKKIF